MKPHSMNKSLLCGIERLVQILRIQKLPAYRFSAAERQLSGAKVGQLPEVEKAHPERIKSTLTLSDGQ